MTVKISCPNKSEALVHHMGKIGLQRETTATREITRGCAEPSFRYGFVSMPPAFNLRS